MSIWDDLGCGGQWISFGDPKQLLAAPSVAAKKLANQKCVVIAVDAPCTGSQATQYPGIELMLWLRLREKYTGPILLVGFQTSEAILAAHPEHLALLAPGNRYERLPISEATKANVQDWVARDTSLTGKNIAEKYKPFLASAFDIGAFRHRMANIYGLKVMWDALRVWKNAGQLAYPGKLPELLAEDQQLQLGMALFEQRIKSTNDRPVKNNQLLDIVCADDYSGLGWSAFFQRVAYGSFDPDRKSFKQIDVQDIGRTKGTLDEKVAAVVALVKVDLDNKHAILLDLMLFPSHDVTATDVAALSGAKVLVALRELDPSIPILVTTASNKIWSYEDVMRLGADGFWVKPGIEDQWSAADAMENTIRLQKFLLACSTDMVRVLRTLDSALLDLEARKTRLWWTDGDWPRGFSRTANADEVLLLLSNVRDLIRSYAGRYLFQGSPNEAMKKRALAGIAATVGYTFESVVGHGFESSEYTSATLQQQARVNNYHLWEAIMKPRHEAVHPIPGNTVSDENIRKQVEALLRFLQGTQPHYPT